MQELKNCPFCGAEAEICESLGHVGKEYVAECTECDALIPFCVSDAEAIAAWNRRAPVERKPIEVLTDAQLWGIAYKKGMVDGMRQVKRQAPEGWKLVPIEPTEEMIRAGCLSQRVGPNTTYEEWWENTSTGVSNRIRKIMRDDYCAMIAAAPSADRQAEAKAGWMPIETAPKDGNLMLLAAEFDGPGDWRIKVGGYWQGEWHVFGASWGPTHWMPLPAAPSALDASLSGMLPT